MSSDKLPEECDASTISKSKPKECAVAEKPESQAASASFLKAPSTPVLEQGGSADATGCTKEKDTAPNEPAPKAMAFGSSGTLTTPPMNFGVPNTKALQSEPDCPKPSFFGASAFSGAAATPPAFAGATANSSEEPKVQGSLKASSSGAFLNLQPPGSVSSTPGKFVFGKSANITLTVPSSSPMSAQKGFAAFGQTAKFGTTPFGAGGFGGGTTAFGTTPFGGGDASKKRPLGSNEKGEEEPETKQSRKEEGEEEGEIVDETENTGEAAAESANLKKDVAKEA